jgi:hypothetical protein
VGNGKQELDRVKDGYRDKRKKRGLVLREIGSYR